MTDEYILRYFPNSNCPEGFGKKSRKGIGSVTLERLENIAERMDKEGDYDKREEHEEGIRYTFKKGEVINCGKIQGDNDLFTLSEDVYVEVRKIKDVPYGSVDYTTGHVNKGIRDAMIISSLKSLSLFSLYNVTLFGLGLPVDTDAIDRVN